MIATADFGEDELRREVPHLGVPLRTVIDGVGGFARGLGSPPPPFRETDPAKIRRARNIKLGLVAAVVGAVILMPPPSRWWQCFPCSRLSPAIPSP